MSDDNVLFKISNLKQHFPLKTKGLTVKAVDGVDVNIVRGETLGLVGESGCGKSTFGRVLLQLYRQTDGKTLYYGQSLNAVAPAYVRETLVNLPKYKEHLATLLEKYQEQNALYEQLKEDVNQSPQTVFEALNASQEAEKRYRNAYLDIVQLIGGFIIVDDLSQITPLLLDAFQQSSEQHRLQGMLADLQLEVSEVQRSISETQKKQRSIGTKEKRLVQLREKIEEITRKQELVRQQLAKANQLIEDQRKVWADNEEFAKHERLRDNGIDLSRLTFAEIRLLRKDMQLIFQDPYSSLNPRMTVGQIIGEGLLAHRFFKRDGQEMQEYVMKVMDECGLATYMIHRYPHQFSGGQRQRIGIARSLALNPQFVVCDEAVSALDVSIQAQIINLLHDLKKKSNLTYLFISHDLAVVKYISDRIAVMYLGNFIELAPTQMIFTNTFHPYTEALLVAIPTTDRKDQDETILLEGDIPSPIKPPEGCKFHTRCRYKSEICTHVVPLWRELEPGHFVACHHPLNNNKDVLDAVST